MGTHEDLTPKSEIKGASDRSFGLVFTAAFALMGVWPLLHGRPVRSWALGISAGFLAVTLARASLLHPLNRIWTRFGLLLHHIVNPIVTGLVFFLVVSPIAFLFRLRGKDPLRLRKDPDAESYWIHRRPPGPSPDSMINQF